MQKITTFLWFNDQAEDAMKFYVSIFKNAKILSVDRMPEGTPGPQGKVMSGSFQIEGQEFMVLNGGPQFPFTEAISLFVNCETQAEVDDLWEKLSAGGSKDRCGWLKDKYGLSWPIIPTALGRMLRDKDPQKAGRVMQAMLQISKIHSAALKRAYDQRGFGRSGGHRAYVDRWSQYHDDVEDRLAEVRSAADGLPVVLYGHSMGGLIALGYVLADPPRPLPDLLVLSAPAIDAVVPAWKRGIAYVLGPTVHRFAVAHSIRNGPF